MDCQSCMSASIDKPENGIIGYLVHEADTPAAHDAAFIIEPDARSNLDILRLLDFHFLKS